ncbi:ACRO protein, partial [Sapayoa aenigma]|nr:ACRO protein [Sapayoa aenigma]
RIVGGQIVRPGTGAWAGLVSVQPFRSTEMKSHSCGGTLIRPQWVLTAAHCFANVTNPLKEWAVVAGTTKWREVTPETQIRRIKRVVMHERYDNGLLYDIALLELDKPMTCSPAVQLACLPDSTVRVSELKNCYVAGWGLTSETEGEFPKTLLREAKALLIDTQLCNSSQWNVGLIKPYHVCAGYPEGGISTCKGDSGGPLVCKDKHADFFWQVGLTSWSEGCARPKRPTVFSSTQYFYGWILNKLR